MRLVPIAAVVLALLAGCRAVEPAPDDLDGQLHWLWDHWEDAPDEDVHEALADLAADAAAALEEGPIRGTVSDLVAAQTEGFSAQDPAEARGFFLVNTFSCELATLEPLLYRLDQDALYPGVYDRYERVYVSDLDAYLAREAPTLGWEIELDATILGSTYTEWLGGELRHLAATEEAPGVLLQRTWMPVPAVFESGSRTFEQDYQLEAYVQRAPGEILHVYAIWREISLGLGLTQDDDAVVNVTLNNLEDWDEQTERLCGGG